MPHRTLWTRWATSRRTSIAVAFLVVYSVLTFKSFACETLCAVPTARPRP